MSNAYFTGSTVKNPLLYHLGETMRFELNLVKDGKPFPCHIFKWTCDTDGGEHFDGECDGTNASAVIVVSVSQPGFAHLTVTPCDENAEPMPECDIFEGGAGADVLNIEQGLPEPIDFDAFWNKQLEDLKNCDPILLEKVKTDSKNINFDCYDIKIQTPHGRPASGYLTIPKNAEKNSLCAKLITIGYGHSSAEVNCTDGFATLCINQHGIENGREKEYYENLRDGELKDFGFNAEQNKKPETCYFKDMILRGLQAARFLKTLPEFNGKLYLEGGSMGAMQAVSIAAHTEGVTELNIHVPWLCDLGGITNGEMRVGRLRGWRPDISGGILYYDTANQAKRVKCPVTIRCGLGDYVCPPSSEVVLWKNFNTPKRIIFVQNKTHSYNAPEYGEYML